MSPGKLFSVKVGVCAHRDIKVATHGKLWALRECPNIDISPIIQDGDALICRSRNRVATHFLKNTDAEFLFFLDDDIVIGTLEATTMMAEAYHNNYEILGAAYPIKSQTKPTMAIMTKDKQGSIQFGKNGSIISVDCVSTGCMLIHRSVLEKMVLQGAVHFCKQGYYTFFQHREALIGNEWDDMSEDWFFPLSPSTEILDAEFNWKPIHSFNVGDCVWGGDENRTSSYGGRKFRVGQVTNMIWSKQQAWRIVTEDQEFITTANHQWLVKKETTDWEWGRTDAISPGDFMSYAIPYSKNANVFDDDFSVGYLRGVWDGDGTIYNGKQQKYARLEMTDIQAIDRVESYFNKFRIEYHRPLKQRYLKNINWKPLNTINVARKTALSKFKQVIGASYNSESYKRGYLSGIFDAEGSCGTSNRLQIANTNQNILDRSYGYSKDIGIEFQRHSDRLVAWKTRNSFDFAMKTKPSIKRKFILDDRRINYSPSKVMSVEKLGDVRDFVCLTTTTGTFFAKGFYSHNCRNAQRLGISVWLDTRPKVIHIGAFQYDWNYMMMNNKFYKEHEDIVFNYDLNMATLPPGETGELTDRRGT